MDEEEARVAARVDEEARRIERIVANQRAAEANRNIHI